MRQFPFIKRLNNEFNIVLLQYKCWMFFKCNITSKNLKAVSVALILNLTKPQDKT